MNTAKSTLRAAAPLPVLEMDWGLSLEDERLEAAVAADGSHECELVHTPCGSYCEICELLGERVK